MARPALTPHKPEELPPGRAVGDDEASLAKTAGDIGTTTFHPVGIEKMGRGRPAVRRAPAASQGNGSARD
ncbi:hypothetical protein [Rhizobium sullae]|uniref:hypothetical protein n=1 Tax=Rhizobium sullae TaxID=50338 RepID=UPI003CC7D898